MLAGELFVLFGLNVKDDTFRAAYKQLAALQIAGSALSHAIRGIGEGLTSILTESAAAGTHILGTAASLGMSTKSVQEWSYVAKQAGSNIDQFVVGISMFERNLREFAAGRGSKRFKDAMQEVGMSVGQAKAALASPDGINHAIFQVSDAYVRMGNTANRAAINTGLFGARARGMAQDLGQGSAVLRQRIKEVNELGGVVGNEQLQKLKDFDNGITRIKTALHGLAMQVVADLAPVFTELIESISAWIKDNRELISDVLGTAFKVLAFVFNVLFLAVKALGALIQAVMNGDGGAIFLFSLLAGGVVMLAIAMITILLPAIEVIGVALWTAMAPLVPFGLLVAAIVGAAILIIQHWGAVKEFFTDLGSWIANVASNIASDFVDAWDSAVSAIKSAFWTAFDAIVEKTIWAVNKIVHALNYIPGVNIGDVGVPDWAKHNTGTSPSSTQAGAPGTPGAPTGPSGANAPATPATRSPSATFGKATGQGPVANVTITPTTTVNIYGVKDAKEASGHIADAIDSQNRHAAAALGGEVT